MKNAKGRYDYGKCHVCGGSVTERLIKQEFWVKGRLLVIEGVPTGVCTRCGEKVVRADVGQQLARLVEHSSSLRKARTLTVPVFRFAEQIA
jgi:YgiT-type zinc finger domain-containing protein